MDPDGREAKNTRNEYVLLKTEEKGFVVLPAYSLYTGKKVVDGISDIILKQDELLDCGKIDGAIYSSGYVVKISDDLRLPWNVDVTLTDKSFTIENFEFDLLGFLPNLKSMVGNLLCNGIKLLSGRFDFSGVKDISEIGWLPRSLSQSELEQLSKNENGTFYTKDYLEEKIREWDKK